MATVPAKTTPNTPAEPLEERFNQLVAKWHAETAYLSDSRKMHAHPAYQEIIRLGQPVVPLILRALEREPDHFHHALHAITGAQPVPREHAGNIAEIAEDWVRWGRENGYRW
jgi:hypothetical protein